MSDRYIVRLVGGQNLTKSKPLFASNEKLFIACDNSIIGFSTRTGKQNQLIKLNENHQHINERIIAYCLHPIAGDFQLFSFTRSGHFFNWNYNDSTLIKEYDLKLSELFDKKYELVWGTVKNYYYDASNHLVVYCAVRYLANEDKYRYKIYATSIDDLNSKEELIDLKAFDERRISFGRNQNYIILIDKVEIYFIGLKDGFKRCEPKKINSKLRALNKDRLKLVCCNPLKDSFAYTCKDGVIRLVTIDSEGNLIDDTKGRLHWHQIQITDMCYSSNGIYLYSVGFESVVVRWNLESLAKNFISNVGYSIKSISCDETNHNIAITLHNNEIRFITSHFDTIGRSLNNLSYFLKKDIETGLVFDPKHDAIVLNGRPGHLQFYSPLTEENLLLLDVANTRFVLKNRYDSKFEDCKSVNIDVYRIAISCCGNWLVTYEMRDDKSTQLETKLKFWRYLKGHNTIQFSGLRINEDYELQTTINLPHKSIINEMKFSKNSNYLITTSQDGSFKIWTSNENNWICLFTYTFQIDLIPNHISVSFDSSMFAINYGDMLTIWNAKELNDVKYIDTFKDSKSDHENEEYLALEFGTGMMSHLLVGCRPHALTVWNVSKGEVKWSYKILENDLHFKNMAYNSSAKNLVLLDSCGHLDVFNINSNDGQPLFRLNVDCELTSNINHLLFINQSNYKFKQSDDLFGDQSICFMDENKKIFVLEHVQSKENREKFKLKSDIMETTRTSNNNTSISNFVQELIDRKANHLKQGDYNMTKSFDTMFAYSDKLNVNKLVDEMFYNVPSHVLPPVQMIAKPFLKSVLNVENRRPEENQMKSKQVSYTKDVEMTENSENKSTPGKKSTNKSETKSVDLFKNEKMASAFVYNNEDYSFLSK